ncbi:MAG: sodium:solute symporter, partial [Planctomycetaceae bacterium]
MLGTVTLLAQAAQRPAFRALDAIVIVTYLLGMAGVGLYFSRRNNSTEEYFVGNRSFPGWVIGLSMLGTTISSVTFLAFPGDAYATDWSKLVANLTLPLVAILAIIVFIPFFR